MFYKLLFRFTTTGTTCHFCKRAIKKGSSVCAVRTDYRKGRDGSDSGVFRMHEKCFEKFCEKF